MCGFCLFAIEFTGTWLLRKTQNDNHIHQAMLVAILIGRGVERVRNARSMTRFSQENSLVFLAEIKKITLHDAARDPVAAPAFMWQLY